MKAAKSEHGGVSASIKARTKSKEITIQDALREKSQAEVAVARKRLEELFSTARAGGTELFEESETPGGPAEARRRRAGPRVCRLFGDPL